MVHRLVVSYGQPEDPAAFDAHYREHPRTAGARPAGPRAVHLRARPLAGPAQAGPYLVAELDFDSEQAMGESMASPEGRAAGKDIANFATGGVTFVHFDVQQAG